MNLLQIVHKSVIFLFMYKVLKIRLLTHIVLKIIKLSIKFNQNYFDN